MKKTEVQSAKRADPSQLAQLLREAVADWSYYDQANETLSANVEQDDSDVLGDVRVSLQFGEGPAVNVDIGDFGPETQRAIRDATIDSISVGYMHALEVIHEGAFDLWNALARKPEEVEEPPEEGEVAPKGRR